jgi:hypothetical protein
MTPDNRRYLPHLVKNDKDAAMSRVFVKKGESMK